MVSTRKATSEKPDTGSGCSWCEECEVKVFLKYRVAMKLVGHSCVNGVTISLCSGVSQITSLHITDMPLDRSALRSGELQSADAVRLISLLNRQMQSPVLAEWFVLLQHRFHSYVHKG